ELLELSGAELSWHDELVSPPVELTLVADARAAELRTGSERPMSFELRARAAELVERASLGGSVRLGADRAQAELELDVVGLRAGPLASYLPAGATATLADGRFAARIDASFAAVPEGGFAFELAVDDVGFHDGERGLLACGPLRAAAARIE